MPLPMAQEGNDVAYKALQAALYRLRGLLAWVVSDRPEHDVFIEIGNETFLPFPFALVLPIRDEDWLIKRVEFWSPDESELVVIAFFDYTARAGEQAKVEISLT